MNISTFSKAVSDLCRTTPRVQVAPIAVCEIIAADGDAITYRRGHSRFKVKVCDLYDATAHFAGRRVTMPEVRAFRPEVFDSHAKPSPGHNCHVGLLFSVLLLLDVAHELKGRGVRGDPYSISMEKRSPNQPPLQTPASGTPAAGAPVAPPSGAAGR